MPAEVEGEGICEVHHRRTCHTDASMAPDADSTLVRMQQLTEDKDSWNCKPLASSAEPHNWFWFLLQLFSFM